MKVATGAGSIVIVNESVTLPHPPAAAMVLVTTYVPGVLVAVVITPVAALMLRPVAGVTVNVPAVAPVSKVGIAVPKLWHTVPKSYVKSALGSGVITILNVATIGSHPPTAGRV